jgi:sec-independent protein translocase protein TatA
MFGIGMPEALTIMVIILIIFGAAKLPEIGSVLGRSIAPFRKATHGPDEVEIKPESRRMIHDNVASPPIECGRL